MLLLLEKSIWPTSSFGHLLKQSIVDELIFIVLNCLIEFGLRPWRFLFRKPLRVFSTSWSQGCFWNGALLLGLHRHFQEVYIRIFRIWFLMHRFSSISRGQQVIWLLISSRYDAMWPYLAIIFLRLRLQKQANFSFRLLLTRSQRLRTGIIIVNYAWYFCRLVSEQAIGIWIKASGVVDGRCFTTRRPDVYNGVVKLLRMGELFADAFVLFLA